MAPKITPTKTAIFGVCLLGCASAANAAYMVRVIGQAGTNPGGVVVDLMETDGPTSLEFDTGIVSDPNFEGTARSAASGDLATGVIRALATDTGDSIARVQVDLADELLFDLPDGMAFSTATFTLAVDGVVSGQFNELINVAELTLQCVGVNMGCVPGNDSNMDAVSIAEFVSPTTLSVSLDVFEGQTYLLSTRVGGSTFAFNGGIDLFDLSNTARLNVVLEDGVSFTSSSGVLLSQVPVPAAVWLFGSALGLLGWVRRRSA